jgi:6-pyruvoyltetrahydropterin/6-carboxytetrahydropterin synthase
MQVELVRTFDFEAAHHHTNQDSRTVHGHRFHVHVRVIGPLCPELGWLVDFGEIKAVIDPLIRQLDHYYLNELPGLAQASHFDIAHWIEKRVSDMPGLTQVGSPDQRLVQVAVECREKVGYEWTHKEPHPDLELPARLAFRFEAAHSLPKTPPEHKCRRLHGHSYEIEIATRDTDPDPELYRTIALSLDHMCLNNIPGLINPTAENLSIWVWQQLLEKRLAPTCVVVGETCESKCIFRGVA